MTTSYFGQLNQADLSISGGGSDSGYEGWRPADGFCPQATYSWPAGHGQQAFHPGQSMEWFSNQDPFAFPQRQNSQLPSMSDAAFLVPDPMTFHDPAAVAGTSVSLAPPVEHHAEFELAPPEGRARRCSAQQETITR